MKVSTIIVAGGSSRRMGFDKLAADLAGRSVLSHSLAAFQNCERIDELILVGSNDPLSENPPPKLHATVPGGAERHLSVAAGLDAVSPDATHIAVHDGARPLITPAAIRRGVRREALGRRSPGSRLKSHPSARGGPSTRVGDRPIARTNSVDARWALRRKQRIRILRWRP